MQSHPHLCCKETRERNFLEPPTHPCQEWRFSVRPTWKHLEERTIDQADCGEQKSPAAPHEATEKQTTSHSERPAVRQSWNTEKVLESNWNVR